MFPQIFGKYVLEREMAAGGMARVYLATLRGAVGFEKRLVVKQIRPELAFDDAFVERFVAEAKMAVELNHPNIVPVYELGVEQGIFYIAMELCEGVTLSEVLNATGPLSPEEGAYVGIEICRALDYAHRRAGIVHRDMTPRNVMLDEEGAVRIIDFGIAAPAALEGADGKKKIEVFGSPGHMPPEQIAGKRLTPATDVFAVGALLLEAWTGKPPFRRATVQECLAALDRDPPRLDEDDGELAPLADLVAAALSRDPEKRPDSAENLARPLRAFVKSADLGDVARRIGERVRTTLTRVDDSAPFAVGEGITGLEMTPSTARAEPRKHLPSISDTQTFAARNDLVEWTRKIPSLPPGPDGEVEAESEAEPELEAAKARRSHHDEPQPTTGDRTSDVGSTRSRWPMIGLVVGGLSLVIWGAPRMFGSNVPPEPITPTKTTASDALVAPPPRTPKSAPSGTEEPRVVPSAVPKRPTTPSGNPRVASASDAQAPVGTASVLLTSNPSSVVSVGNQRGTTPFRANLPEGDHTIDFRIDVINQSTKAFVKVKAGQSYRVYVDFTGPSPRVSSN